MPWWVWIGIGAFAVALVAAAVFAVAAYGRIRRLRASAEAIAARAEEVGARSAELELRLAHAGERAEAVPRHFGRLNASLERLSVLSWALGDARKGVGRLRGAYLRR